MTTTLLQKEYMMQNRLNWLDSMKALGVFIIVSGHYFPPNHELLYVLAILYNVRIPVKKRIAPNFYTKNF